MSVEFGKLASAHLITDQGVTDLTYYAAPPRLRLGCEHPTPINITAMSDPSDIYRCVACGADWCGERRRRP